MFDFGKICCCGPRSWPVCHLARTRNMPFPRPHRAAILQPMKQWPRNDLKRLNLRLAQLEQLLEAQKVLQARKEMT